jgi:hypothetical protein
MICLPTQMFRYLNTVNTKPGTKDRVVKKNFELAKEVNIKKKSAENTIKST